MTLPTFACSECGTHMGVMFVVKLSSVIFCLLITSQIVVAQAGSSRLLSGVVLTEKNEVVPGVTVHVTTRVRLSFWRDGGADLQILREVSQAHVRD